MCECAQSVYVDNLNTHGSPQRRCPKHARSGMFRDDDGALIGEYLWLPGQDASSCPAGWPLLRKLREHHKLFILGPQHAYAAHEERFLPLREKWRVALEGCKYSVSDNIPFPGILTTGLDSSGRSETGSLGKAVLQSAVSFSSSLVTSEKFCDSSDGRADTWSRKSQPKVAHCSDNLDNVDNQGHDSQLRTSTRTSRSLLCASQAGGGDAARVLAIFLISPSPDS
jgi:hypothetical protein